VQPRSFHVAQVRGEKVASPAIRSNELDLALSRRGPKCKVKKLLTRDAETHHRSVKDQWHLKMVALSEPSFG
jgi:hypothetical protein